MGKNIFKNSLVFFVLLILIFSEVGFIIGQNAQNIENGVDVVENNNGEEEGLGILDAKNQGFFSIIGNVFDCLLNPLACALPPLVALPPIQIPGVPICKNRNDCLAAGFIDPAPYCDGNFKVLPRVWCFNRGNVNAYCGVHNTGRNRRECQNEKINLDERLNRFCKEIDIDNDGVIDNAICAKGVNCNNNGVCEYGEDKENCIDCHPTDPEPPKPPWIPPEGPPFPPAPPGPGPPDISCKNPSDCSLPPGEEPINCEDRNGDGVADELVRKKPCCLGIGSNKDCNVCDKVSYCNYGCGWREDMDPPRIFCCSKNSDCDKRDEPGCDGDGICEDGEIPGICPDCPICNGDGNCDRELGENFNNCVQDCALPKCCSNDECGERTYECEGDIVFWRTPRCKNICTNEAFCSESYIKSDCSKLGKFCEIGSDGKSRCVDFRSDPSNMLSN